MIWNYFYAISFFLQNVSLLLIHSWIRIQGSSSHQIMWTIYIGSTFKKATKTVLKFHTGHFYILDIVW